MAQQTVFASGSGSLAIAISRELKTKSNSFERGAKHLSPIRHTAKSKGMMKKTAERVLSGASIVSSESASSSSIDIKKKPVYGDIIKRNILSVKVSGGSRKGLVKSDSPPSATSLNGKGSPNNSFFGNSMIRNAGMTMHDTRTDDEYTTSDTVSLLKQIILLRLMTVKRSQEEKTVSEGDLLDAWGLVRDAEDEAAQLEMKDKIVTSIVALHKRLEIINATLNDVNSKLRQ